MKEQQDKLKYPIGNFEYGKTYSLDDTRKHIKILAKFPKEVKSALKKLKSGELEKTYRPEGWTVRQVVNHLADSHMNAYTRLKLAVTENTPIIKPYEEQLWAELEDGKHGSIKTSVKLLAALHDRWSHFLKSLQIDDLEKGYYHPASKRTVTVQEAIALYVWHSQHHLAHIYLVVNGKSKKTIGKKSSASDKGGESDDKPKSAAPVQAPKKRTITPEHREKIRAAQMARHAKNADTTTESAATAAPAKRGRKPGAKAAATSDAAATPAKRGRKPGVKAAATSDTTATPAKRGRKPGVKAAATSDTTATPAKRGRKPGAKAAATSDATATPAKRGRKPGVKAAATSDTTATPAKRGRKPGVKAAATSDATATPAKRGRKPGVKAAATSDATATPAKRGRKPGVKAAATSDTTATPAKRGRKPGVKAAATSDTTATPAKRGSKPGVKAAAASTDATAKRTRRSKAEMEAARTNETAIAATPVKAPKAVKPAKKASTPSDGAPKKRGLTPERMAEIRALRGIKKAAESTAKPVKTAKAAKVKTTATTTDGAPKKRGLSAERMAEIRAMRGTKKK